MWEKQLRQRLLVCGAVIVVALILLWPPKDKLRPGLDIAGGVSMIFEIQEEEGERDPYLAEAMKRLLQKRVDPQGVYDLKWRVHGNNRIEVQMPLPPEDTARLRADYLKALERVFAENTRRTDLESAFGDSGPARDAALSQLAGGNPDRLKLLQEAAAAYDAYTAALAASQRAATTQPEGEGAASPPTSAEAEVALRDAAEELEDAIDEVLASNLNEQRFTEVLEMAQGSPRRDQGLKDFKQRYPTRAEAIDDCVRKFDTWRVRRTFLDGPADLRRLLRGAGVLEFRILAEPSPENITKYDRYREQLREYGPRPQPGDLEQWFRVDNPAAFLNLSPAELRTFDPRQAALFVVEKHNDAWYVLAKRGPEHGLLRAEHGGAQWKLKGVGLSRDQSGRRAVAFSLDPYGGQLFRRLTGDNIGKQLCIFVDDVAYSSANIIDAIGSHGQITGDFSNEKISYLIQTMQAGSLPGRLKDTPISERTIGSSLGHKNLELAFRSGLIAAVAVFAIMLGYYLVCGAIANAALAMNILLVLAVMAMLGARFTLSGIAGIILTIGMAVDANVLIYERMREEQERGASLRMIIKNGYDKAFSTIVDSNLTTLLSAVIIYYVGSEEIKGFGLTLGWGIVISLFTALYFTRTLFTLLVKYGLLKEIRMMKLIGVPNIDWYGMRGYFIAGSLAIIITGLSLLYWRGKNDTLDIEFLGGVEAEIAFKPNAAGQFNDRNIRAALEKVGREIADQGRALADASVHPVEGAFATYRVQAPGIPADRLAAMIAEPLESGESGDLLQRGGVSTEGGADSIVVRVRENVTQEQLTRAVHDLADRYGDSVPLTGDNIARPNVNAVLETGEGAGRSWSITTTATNKALVQHALVTAFGDNLDIRPRVTYSVEGPDGQALPITDRRLDTLIPGLPPAAANVADYLGGAAIHLTHLSPPQAIEELKTRLKSMRLQPDYQNLPWRNVDVLPAGPAATNAEGQSVYESVVIVVADPAYPYNQNPDLWATEFAQPEVGVVRAALDTEQTLRRVSQFKPQVAEQSQTQALLALLLSWAMIIAYVWVRFGRISYGFAGVIALVHDVLIALAFVGVSGLIGGTALGSILLIGDFKIDMTIIAALLTIIGYSINDTIVIFDRIRELRGRLGVVSPKLINDAVNQTMSRTILTSLTVLCCVLTMYTVGGESIRGFNFCMLIGLITGVYSTVAIAAPVLLFRSQVRTARQPGAAPAHA
jgi:SecD/SecF fusion protein